jgi:2-isopropylmalate synthase
MGGSEEKSEGKERDKIYIFDTTLRDGEQSPGASMSMDEKIQVAKALEELNVDIIEAGFPVSSEDQFLGVRRIAEEINGPIITGLARCSENDIKVCANALSPAKKKRIHVFISTSHIHMEKKLQKS